MMLDGGEYDGQRIIADSTIALFTKRAAGTRALGWDTCGGSGSCGQYLGEDAYGHTGFTGTSLWIDPERKLSVTFLTNRTWPDCKSQLIREVRPRVHDAIVEALEE